MLQAEYASSLKDKKKNLWMCLKTMESAEYDTYIKTVLIITAEIHESDSKPSGSESRFVPL